MFRIGSCPDDPALLEQLIERFTTLTNARAAFADIGAVALLVALTICALHTEAQ